MKQHAVSCASSTAADAAICIEVPQSLHCLVFRFVLMCPYCYASDASCGALDRDDLSVTFSEYRWGQQGCQNAS